MAPALSVVVLHYDNKPLTDVCLAHLMANKPLAEAQIVVVDNGSRIPYTTDYDPQVQVRRIEDNVGNIEGMNRCFQVAEAPWVLFVANDVRLDGDCIRVLWEEAQRLPELGVLQPLLVQPDGWVDNRGLNWRWPGYGERIRWLPINHERRPPREVDAFAATCFLMRKEVFLGFGGFEPQLGISHEDVDLSLRLRQMGLRCYGSLQARAMHLMGQTISKRVKNLSGYYHAARIRVIQRNYTGWRKTMRLAAVGLLDGLAERARGG